MHGARCICDTIFFLVSAKADCKSIFSVHPKTPPKTSPDNSAKFVTVQSTVNKGHNIRSSEYKLIHSHFLMSTLPSYLCQNHSLSFITEHSQTWGVGPPFGNFPHIIPFFFVSEDVFFAYFPPKENIYIYI